MNSFFILFFLSVFHKFKSYIYFPILFKENNELNFIENLIQTEVYTNIRIGTPFQNIPIHIKFNSEYFYISGRNILNHNYNEEKSSSYFTTRKSRGFFQSDINNGVLSNETFYFSTKKNNNLKAENFAFILANNITNFAYTNVMGLKICPNPSYEDSNFIFHLKYNNLIDYYIFTVDLKNINNGQLIIGEYPHDYASSEFDQNYFKTSRAGKNMYRQNWEMLFSKVYINNEIIGESIYGLLDIEVGCLIGTNLYKTKIYTLYFKELIDKKICFENVAKNINNTYYYICNKNINIKDFPSLNFYNQEMNIFFNFTYEDLFIEKNNQIFFLIVFSKEDKKDWVLGRIFMKKYQFMYDLNRKLFGYCTKKNKSHSIIFIIINIILAIIIIFLLLYLKKILKNKKKLLYAKELKEEVSEPLL